MPDITIRFKHNPTTGQRELVIAYESERDALPHEHEQDHRAVAQALVGSALSGTTQGVEVSRVTHEPAQTEPAQTEPAARQAQTEKR